MDASAIHYLTGSPVADVGAQARVEQLAERREIVQAVQALNQAESFGPDKELTYSFDRDTRRTILKIVQRETGEVINQIPSEDVLRMARSLSARSLSARGLSRG